MFEQIGGFDPELGPLGEGIGRGDDTDFFSRALALGHKGLYLPEALVAHRFDAIRVTLPYLFRYGVEKGLRLPPENNLFKLSARVLEQALRGLVQRGRGRKDRAFQCAINIGIAFGRHRA